MRPAVLAFVPSLPLFLALLLLAAPAAVRAESLLWPVQGELRECPEFLDMALYPDKHAGNTVLVQADVPGDVAGAVAYTPLHPPRNAEEQRLLSSRDIRGNGTARRNTVLVQRGVVEGFADGGWSSMGAAQDNILVLSGGTVRKLARGGGSNGGPAQGNALYMTAGQVEGSAIGGSSLRHTASGNTLILSAGEVRDAAVGGSSGFGHAESNTVIMGGGTARSVVGGSSGHGNVQGNVVQVRGGTVTRDIVGGETANGELATQNTVLLGRQAQLAPQVRVFGGLKRPLPGADAAGETQDTPDASRPDADRPGPAGKADGPRDEFAFKGNVLKVQWQGRLRGVYNFQYWHFTLPDTVAAGSTVLTVDEEVDLRHCVLDVTELPRASASLDALRPGDSIVLVRAPLLHAGGIRFARTHITRAETGQEFTLALDNARHPTAVVLTLTRVLPGRPPE